jgi:HSP20 family protein
MTERKALKAFEPDAMTRQLFRDVESMFEGRWLPLFYPLRQQTAPFDWYPDLELFERDNRFVARFDLPGLKKEQINVEATDGALTVFGERKEESKEEKPEWYRSERTYGSFLRTIPLPEGVKPADVAATFADGVLEVSYPLPAKPETTARTVPVTDPAAGKKAA